MPGFLRFLYSTMTLVLLAGSHAVFADASGASIDTRVPHASTACIAASEPIPNWNEPPPPDCSVSWELLGGDGDRLLYAGRYSWPSHESDWSLRQGYKIVTQVLFEARKGDASAAPIWHLRQDETYEYLRSVSLADVGGQPIVKVYTCLNGTGGCGTALYRWAPGRLVQVRTDIRGQIEHQLPPGYSLNKFPEIDLKSMRVVGGAWLREDPDCCPSARLHCELRLEHDRAKVNDCRLAPIEERRRHTP